jgi:hypothetical protein
VTAKPDKLFCGRTHAVGMTEDELPVLTVHPVMLIFIDIILMK